MKGRRRAARRDISSAMLVGEPVDCPRQANGREVIEDERGLRKGTRCRAAGGRLFQIIRMNRMPAWLSPSGVRTEKLLLKLSLFRPRSC